MRASTASTSSAALAAPGVLKIFTGADLAEAKVGGLPCGWLIHSKDGSPMKEPPHPVLAQGKVRHVGDQVALVVAETYLQAKDAAELIEVDYDVLPAVVDTPPPRGHATAVHDDVPGNVCYDWGHGTKDAVDAAFAQAAKVTQAGLRQQPADPQRDGAARGQRDVHQARRQLHAVRQPTRTRTSSAC
jgi:carbon-monoxide dehydrogenase large subunit